MEHAASWQPQTPEQALATLQQHSDRRMFSPETLRELAAKVGLDLARYDADIKDSGGGPRVDGEYAAGEEHGVSFVPAVFFGTELYEGAMDVDALSSAIDARLHH